jgi:hypothetical protein
MSFTGAIRSLFAVEFGLGLFFFNIHLLGFGLRAVYQSGEHATLLVQLPFYEAAVSRYANRFPGIAESSTPHLVRSGIDVQKGIDERSGRADYFAEREGLNK